MNSHTAYGGNNLCRRAIESLDGIGVGTLVESGIFNRRAQQDTAIAARNDVDLWRTNDVLHNGRFSRVLRRRNHADHLSFCRTGGHSERLNLRGPSPRTVDDDAGGIARMLRFGADNATVLHSDFAHS